MKVHASEIKAILASLGSDATTGLSDQEAQVRLAQQGENKLPEHKRRSLAMIFARQFLSPLIYLLIIAALISLIIGDQKDAIVILIVVVLNAMIGALQEGRAEQSLEALRKLSKLKARVRRCGQEREIEASQIVPGDLIILTAGDAVPADARLVEASSLRVAEAALTGESVPVEKSIAIVDVNAALADRCNMLFAGTYVTSGRAVAIVTTTGVHNEIGKIASLTTSTEQPKTQLELRIENFGKKIVFAAIGLFFLVLAIGKLRGIPFADIFMIAVSQTVSLVPEGLPVALTIALAVGVQRMARRGTIVRRLSAVETLGSTTIICSDKTGTLTKNEMTVTSLFIASGLRKIQITGAGYLPEGQFVENDKSFLPHTDRFLLEMLEASVLCNDAQLLAPDGNATTWRMIGDPTEGALLTAAAKAGIDISRLRKQYPRQAEIPFDSAAKLMATQHDDGNHQFIIVKGAPEAVFNLCHDDKLTGELQNQNPSLSIAAQQTSRQMADSALRVLAIAKISGATIDGSLGFDQFVGRTTLLGLIGELDPPRAEVAESVRECLAAGIKPVMVTGDHKATGLAIAKSLGIFREGDLAVDGRELDELSDEELSQQINRVSVFARVHPAQKLRIVEAIQKKGNVVAMTGDGVNDAPALVRADVGVAMGITGTEVAKEAAKIVITDDNFSTIVAAVAEGRLVYQNIKKLVLFLFVTSIDEVIVLFLALVMGYPPPLAAVQILWINLVSEGALTVNLIMEAAEGNEMQRTPIALSEPLFDRQLLSRLPLMVLASVISTLGWFLYKTHIGTPAAQVQTETFTVLVVCQWFNVLNCRSAIQSAFSMSLFKNKWLIIGLVVANIMHLLVIYWPPLASFFHTVPLKLEQFITIGIVASLVLWVEELRKWLARQKIS